jgi:hypothetical protein
VITYRFENPAKNDKRITTEIKKVSRKHAKCFPNSLNEARTPMKTTGEKRMKIPLKLKKRSRR